MQETKRRKKVGLYFGSFNPIHNGHLILANHIVNNSDLEEVWFVVSRQNPFKERKGLLSERQRLALVELAIEGNPRFRSCDIELHLPAPSYTVNTLAYLGEKHQNLDFAIIMGQDNILTLHKWKNHEAILEYYSIIVYPRPHCESCELLSHPNVTMIDAPQMDISSSQIRQNIRQNKSVQYLLPDSVRQEIEKAGYYRR